MERAPGDFERDLDLDFGRMKTPDLLRRLLDEPWCFDEWWDLRLITEAESQPSRKPMVDFGTGREARWSSCSMLCGVSEPPLAVEFDSWLSLGLDGPVRSNGRRHDLSPRRLEWVMSDSSRGGNASKRFAAVTRLDGGGQLSGAQLSLKR